MAVYTVIDGAQLQALLSSLNLGRLRAFTGVADGVENTTYFVTTEPTRTNSTLSDPREWVLTILETDDSSQTTFCTALMAYLRRAGLPVPLLAGDRNRNTIHHIVGKSAMLASRASGAHPDDISADHCAAIGQFLGQMHLATVAYPYQRVNPFGLNWASTAIAALPREEESSRCLINEQLLRWRKLDKRANDLPVGVIHGDLFCDNALFVDGKLSAVIDFQSACTDWLLLDVAIAINDWSSTEDGQLDTKLASALLDGYQTQRVFTASEREVWQDVLCIAATRFWLSRLLSRRQDPAGGGIELTGRLGKDPEQYARILRHRMNDVVALPRSLFDPQGPVM